MKTITLRKKWIVNHIFFILLFIVMAHTVWAGQVITQEARKQAKDALKMEEALEPITIRSPNTLAVLYYFNRTGQTELMPIQKGLALMLITDLSKVRGIQVVERAELQALLDEMNLGVSGLVDPNTAPRINKLLRAQWILGGEIGESQALSIQISSYFSDVPKQETLKEIVVKGELTALFDLEKEILFDIIKILKIELTPDEKEELQKPFSTNINALMVLFRAIEAGDNKEYQKAADYCEKALKIDPKIEIADKFLKEIRNLGLIPVKKPSKIFLNSLKKKTSLTDQTTHKDPTKRRFTPSDIQQKEDILQEPTEGSPKYQYWETDVINPKAK